MADSAWVDYAPRKNYKMANWVARQRRHLSPEEFKDWVASRYDVQAFLTRQETMTAAERDLERLQNQILRKVIKPGLEAGSEFLVKIEKADARGLSRTGVLAQSIGSTRAKLYPATFCGYIASGPRRGYARAVQVHVSAQGRIQLKRLSKKQTLIMTATRKQIPTEYAYYLTKGRRAVQPVNKKALLTAMGRFFSHAKAAPPKDFMAPARAQSDQAANVATKEMDNRLQTILE
jgi:hypothetical protein